MKLSPAVFLDRDGVINREKEYLYRIEDFEFLPNVLSTCKAINASGYKIVVITNQSGIARGYYDEEQFNKLTSWMVEEFRANGVEISGVYYCPHHPKYSDEMCNCRKPQPGMILQAAKEHAIDLKSSMMIGDKLSDVEAGRNAGVGRCYLITTGHEINDNTQMVIDGIFKDFSEVRNIL
ncbi:MAG: D-glycero-beta-D-manno-heptose 1,7-bisphosphate 7-phosphatase [Lentisphaeria bacterium]